MMILILLAAHQGEEFVIILPAILLVGAFFVMRWANQTDETAADASVEAEAADLAEEAAVGAAPSPSRRDADETTR